MGPMPKMVNTSDSKAGLPHKVKTEASWNPVKHRNLGELGTEFGKEKV